MPSSTREYSRGTLISVGTAVDGISNPFKTRHLPPRLASLSKTKISVPVDISGHFHPILVIGYRYTSSRPAAVPF